MKLHSFKIRIAALAVIAAGGLSIISCGRKESRLEASFPEKFEGKKVELVAFRDSSILLSDTVRDGKVVFDNSEILSDEPLLAELMIEGRVKAFAIIEPGKAIIADSTAVAQGTPLNNRFFALMQQLDSVENLDDMDQYVVFAEKKYNENKDNVIGDYLGLEIIKFGNPAKVDSFLNVASRALVESRKAERYIRFANLRKATSPGHKYVDFTAGQGKNRRTFGSFITPGKYTLVDFWASWCPYCIKELPELKQLYADYSAKGLNIVGVAVRDQVADTRTAVAKHQIPWSVMYDTQRIPYDIYGFTGIPHLMLIGPDGTIISRGETPEKIRMRLDEAGLNK